jgi:hypothetical protein
LGALGEFATAVLGVQAVPGCLSMFVLHFVLLRAALGILLGLFSLILKEKLYDSDLRFYAVS